MARGKTVKGPAFPLVVETWRDPTNALQGMAKYHSGPSCINDDVDIRRYRVTAELIEEPKEVLIERVRKLWRESDNNHHWGPLQAVARSLGVELAYAEFGKDRKKS